MFLKNYKKNNSFCLLTLPSSRCNLGVELSFKTWSPDGLLLCAFSPEDQEEFLAVQIKNGRPYFLFDPQVLSPFVTLHQ